MNASLGKEIGIKVANKIGVVMNVAKVVAEKGVNIRALHGMVDGSNCIVRLVTDDNLRAVEALRARNYHPFEESVVEIDIPNRPGMLESITSKLAMDDVDLYHIYATVGTGGNVCHLVLSTTNNERAVVSLNH